MKYGLLAILALSVFTLSGCVIHERQVYRSYSKPKPGYYQPHRDRDHPRYPYYRHYRHRYR